MLDIVIGWRVYETELNGNKITMELLPLKAKQMMILLPIVKQVSSEKLNKINALLEKKKEEDEKIELDDDTFIDIMKNNIDLQIAAEEIIASNVRKIEGLTINGKKIETSEQIHELCQHYIFNRLIDDIIGELMKISQLAMDGEDRKN